MSKPEKPQPVLFFTGLLFDRTIPFEDIEEELKSNFGEIDLIMDPVEFRWTEYYTPEMGEKLLRTWVSFEKLIMPDELIEKKHIAYEIEKSWANDGFKRRINIDPGIMTPAKLILSTFKDFSHMIFLGDGVYAEVTLLFSGGDFKSLQWSFADYRDIENQKFFHLMRNSLKQKIVDFKNLS